MIQQSNKTKPHLPTINISLVVNTISFCFLLTSLKVTTACKEFSESLCNSLIIFPILLTEFLLCSANFLISSATTANPLPASPALALSIEAFNDNNNELLQNYIKKGFVVEFFNTNGFNNGYHILEANPDTTARFALINSKLYDFLIAHSFGPLTDKTTPKTINPKGYTPHIEFLETAPEKIPVKGDLIHFKDWHLRCRILQST